MTDQLFQVVSFDIKGQKYFHEVVRSRKEAQTFIDFYNDLFTDTFMIDTILFN